MQNQHGNDPKHSSKLLKEWFTEHNVHIMEWPAQSSGLNSIEHLPMGRSWETVIVLTYSNSVSFDELESLRRKVYFDPKKSSWTNYSLLFQTDEMEVNTKENKHWEDRTEVQRGWWSRCSNYKDFIVLIFSFDLIDTIYHSFPFHSKKLFT